LFLVLESILLSGICGSSARALCTLVVHRDSIGIVGLYLSRKKQEIIHAVSLPPP
jgi:hypothetical protein